MYHIETDQTENRLLICLSGVIDMVQAKKLFFDLMKAFNQLKPGFHIINNLKDYETADLNAAFIFKRSVAIARQHQVGQIIRVVGASKNAVLQFEANTLKQTDYRVSYVATMEEALEIIRNSDV